MRSDTETCIYLIEDDLFVVEDIKRSIERSEEKGLDVREIENPSNFLDVFCQILFKLPDGILVDINLSRFEFNSIFIGDTQVTNGVDIAIFFSQFIPSIPIAVYSAYLEDFMSKTDLLREKNIDVFDKAPKSFEKILGPFYKKVEDSKNDLTISNRQYSIDEFNALNFNQQNHYFKQQLTYINSNKYFQAIGDYAWVVKCGEVIKELHGPLLVADSLSGIQKNIADKYDILGKEPPQLSTETLEKLAVEHNEIPIIYWNLRTMDCLENNIHYQAKTYLEDLEVNWKRLFYLQVAQALAHFYSEGVSVNRIIKVLEKLDNFSCYEFQKQLLLANQDEIASAEQIEAYLEPFGDFFKNRITILDIFTGYVEMVDEENDADTAWVVVENVFDDDIELYKPFSLSVLKENEIRRGGTEFYYIVYKNYMGDISVRLEPFIT